MEDVYRQFVGVLLVLGILVTALYLLKQRGIVRFKSVRGLGGPDRLVKVVERIPLDAQHTVHLVQIGERRILIASSPGSCQLITEVSEQEASGGAGR
jgi:flagellar biogenesis protein FliO